MGALTVKVPKKQQPTQWENKSMRKLRLAAAATSLTLISAVSSVGIAGAAEVPGVGTTQAITTLVGVELGNNGSLLNLRLVGDDARATIDKLIAPTEAFSKLVPASLTSSVVPALNIALPSFESRSPGGASSVPTQSINLNNAVPGLGALPLSVLGGSLNLGNLTSSIDGGVAKSALDLASGNLNLVGGVLSISELSSKMGASAAGGQADGARTIKVGTIKVLDLGGLLDGLGIKLTDLPLSTVTGLLTNLGVAIPGVGNGAQLQSLVDGALAQVTTLTGTLSGAGVPVDVVTDIVGTLGLGSVINTGLITGLTDPVARATELIEQLQAVIAGLLNTAMGVLDDFSLLQIDGLEIGVVTKAVKDLSGSVADITAKVGDITVAGLKIPGLDLGGALAQVNGLVNTINTTLSSTLGSIAPGLANLVDVSVLEKVSSVVNEGGYNRSRAGVTALTATIKPPVDLAGILNTLRLGTSVGDLIGLGGLPIPSLGSAMGLLEGTLGGAVQALAQGATVKVAEVMAASDYAAPAGVVASAPGGELPRTGSATGLMALVAMCMAGMAFAVRRFSRVPVSNK